MTEQEFKEILHKKETDTVEFKSWVNARNYNNRISVSTYTISLILLHSKCSAHYHFDPY